MILAKKLFSALIIASALLFAAAPTPGHAAEDKALFVNLTSADTWKATMAISFAHKMALKNGFKPVTIFVNTQAVNLIDTTRPSQQLSTVDANVQQLFVNFIKDGGRVLVCGMCAKVEGIEHKNMLKGTEMGAPGAVMAALFNQDTRTLTW